MGAVWLLRETVQFVRTLLFVLTYNWRHFCEGNGMLHILLLSQSNTHGTVSHHTWLPVIFWVVIWLVIWALNWDPYHICLVLDPGTRDWGPFYIAKQTWPPGSPNILQSLPGIFYLQPWTSNPWSGLLSFSLSLPPPICLELDHFTGGKITYQYTSPR